MDSEKKMGDFERVNFEIDIMRRILFSSLFMREHEPIRLKVVNTRQLASSDRYTRIKTPDRGEILGTSVLHVPKV